MVEPVLDKRLNLVLEVERDDKSICYIHSAPISRNLWKTHYTFLSMSINSLYADGFPPSTCARIIYNRMLEIAEQQKDRFGNLSKTLFPEIWRLTNVLVPTDQGFDTVSFYDAMRDPKILDQDNVEEVQNFICFFTAASWVHGLSRKEREAFQQLMTKGFGVQITSLPVTEYKSSIPISKPEENIGEKETPLFMPA
jgi:hypothetical protein